MFRIIVSLEKDSIKQILIQFERVTKNHQDDYPFKCVKHQYRNKGRKKKSKIKKLIQIFSGEIEAIEIEKCKATLQEVYIYM